MATVKKAPKSEQQQQQQIQGQHQRRYYVHVALGYRRRLLRYYYDTFSNSIMSIDEEFNKACQDVKNLKSRPTDKELLDLYGLYKQGTEGKCTKERPGALELKAKAKWDAWDERKDMTQDAAKEAYVTLANEIISKYEA